MKVKILKDDPCGLVKGQIKTLRDTFAKEMIKKGLVEEVKAKKATGK